MLTAAADALASTSRGGRALAARRGLAVYFAALVPATAVLETLLIHTGDPIDKHPLLIVLLMWVPALSSFVARAALREGLADVSFRLGGRAAWPAVLIAFAMALAVGAVAYGAAWSSGLAAYRTPPHGGFLPYLALALTAGTAIGILFAAGEEIGWRGYMLTRLVDAGVPHPLLASGLIWAAWHLPLILTGQYAAGPHPALSAAVFVAAVLGAALVIGILRLRSGSVWPPILLHAAWNAVIQGPFDHAATGPGATTWVGESGVLVGTVTLAAGIAAVLLDRRWPATAPPAS